MKTAADLMTRNPICFSLNQKVSDLFHLFVEHRMSLVPVVDESKKPIGLIEDAQIYKILIRHHFDEKAPQQEKLADYKSFIGQPVIVFESTPIQEVLKKLGQSKTNRVFVIDSLSGHLSGIISPIDVVDFIMGEEKHLNEMHKKLKNMQSEIGNLKGKVENLTGNLNVYQAAFENSPYMMHSMDQNGKIVMANKVMHDQLKYNSGELIGKTIDDIYPENYRALAKQALKKVIREGRFEKMYMSMTTKEKWLISVDVASSALYDENGKFVATITSSRALGLSPIQEALTQVSETEK